MLDLHDTLGLQSKTAAVHRKVDEKKLSPKARSSRQSLQICLFAIFYVSKLLCKLWQFVPGLYDTLGLQGRVFVEARMS